MATAGNEVIPLELDRDLAPALREERLVLLADGLPGALVAVGRHLFLVEKPDRLKTAVFHLEFNFDFLVSGHWPPPFFVRSIAAFKRKKSFC